MQHRACMYTIKYYAAEPLCRAARETVSPQEHGAAIHSGADCVSIVSLEAACAPWLAVQNEVDW